MSVEATIHRRLAEAHPHALPDRAQIEELVRGEDPLRSQPAVERSVAVIVDLLSGLGPIEPLLRDPEVSDVLINGPGPVWIERCGVLERSDVSLNGDQVSLMVERIVAPLGRRADPSHPLVEGRLNDGSRVQVVVPPVAVDGPCLAIRRFAVQPIALEDLGPPGVVRLLRDAVADRRNIVVSGATGTGKTTLLNALAGEVDSGERIVTVEDAAELRLGSEHVVRLEARATSVEGPGQVSIRDLVRVALRMRPDRVVVGEVRGAEALDLLMAMNTGHDGSLSTLHANSARDALVRLETLVLLADVGLPLAAIRAQIFAAVDLVVHLARDRNGARTVREVVELGVGPGSQEAVHSLVEAGHVLDRQCVTGDSRVR